MFICLVDFWGPGVFPLDPGQHFMQIPGYDIPQKSVSLLSGNSFISNGVF